MAAGASLLISSDQDRLAIFLAFQRDADRAHPHRDAAVGNYIQPLRSQGKGAAGIKLALAALWREARLHPE